MSSFFEQIISFEFERGCVGVVDARYRRGVAAAAALPAVFLFSCASQTSHSMELS
jgi:hypothetical protein